MSDTVSLGGNVNLTAQAATIETIFDHMRRRAPDNTEFQALLARSKEFDAIGGWFFDSLSLDGLFVLKTIIDNMAGDLQSAAAHWNAERRHLFYGDFERFRTKLTERIDQLNEQRG